MHDTVDIATGTTRLYEHANMYWSVSAIRCLLHVFEKALQASKVILVYMFMRRENLILTGWSGAKPSERGTREDVGRQGRETARQKIDDVRREVGLVDSDVVEIDARDAVCRT